MNQRSGVGAAGGSGAAASVTEGSGRSSMWWIAAFVVLVLLVFQGGDLAWSDGISMYHVARSIVEDGDVVIVQGVVWQGADGRYYSPFGIGLSLLAVPV